jgi:two-component system NtrC family sensor kinase
MGEGITGAVAASRRGEIVNHAETDPRTVTLPNTILEPEAVLAVPLFTSERLLGVLTLHKLDGRTFDPVDLDKLETFAGTAAAALENVQVAREHHLERSLLTERLEQIPDGIVFTDSDDRITMLNRAAANLLRVDEERSVGTKLTKLLEKSGFAHLCVALATLEKGGLSRLSREIAVDGRTYVCSISSMGRKESVTRGRTLLFQDVTDLKEAEAQLHQSSKMSAVGQLAAGVAHEFNNLIAGIYGYAQFMKEHSDPDVVQKGVDVILRSSERARELTESLLTFSHRRPGRKEPVDLNQILMGERCSRCFWI